MRRVLLLTAWVVLVGGVLAAPLAAGSSLPERIALPNGFRPEGIEIKGSTFYVGSIPTGAIYRGDLRSGEGSIFVPGAATGRAAIGLEYDDGKLIVAGGGTGSAFVYSARSGNLLATHVFTTPPGTFVNDVVATKRGAYFTDSQRPFIYRLSTGRGPDGFEAIPLSGDYVHLPAPANNLNGIEATRDGRKLIAVQSGSQTIPSKLFTIDPGSGEASEIALDEEIRNGDGLLLDGRTLYVVQNRDNLVAVVKLDRRLSSGTVVARITNPGFDVPTTMDDFGDRFYAVNARFGTTPTPDTEYWITQFRAADDDDDDDDDDD
jgi:sugar lactone lactonase YvrE